MLLSKYKFHDSEFIWSPTLLKCINECLYFAHLLFCLGKIRYKRDARIIMEISVVKVILLLWA
jgi:hypothetical protein